MKRAYCFTSFQIDQTNFKNYCLNMKNLRYIIVGLEVCPKTKKEHYQAYVQFDKAISFLQAKKRIWKGAHIEAAQGSVEENQTYCSKENIFFEWGKAKSQGQRTDLENLMEEIREGKTDISLAEQYPCTFERYYRFIAHYRDMLKTRNNEAYLKEKFDKGKVQLNSFQKDCITLLKKQTERQVLWIKDGPGGAGKTFLSKYLLANENAFYTSNGKNSDISYAYNSQPYFIMDLSRSLQEHVNYGIIESVKNGILFSSKYKSTVKIFEPPKVIILANFFPTTNKLSLDRWQQVPLEMIKEWNKNINKSSGVILTQPTSYEISGPFEEIVY